MQMYLTSSENMELVKFTAGVVGTLLYFCIVLALWRILWCATYQLTTPAVMKVTGLTAYWIVWVIMLAVWLALDPLFTDASILLGVLAGMIIAAIICIMIAIDILLCAYMRKRQDEHHEEVLM